MGKFMKPDLKVDTIFDITPDMLEKNGIKGLFFDIDNTLEEYATKIPGEKTIEYFRMLNDCGLKIGILSNAKEERAENFISGFPKSDFPNILFVGKAGKPLSKGFKCLASKMQLDLNEIAMVGDQLYTDIFGGNNAGCFTILVIPINIKIEPWFVRFKRILEKPFM